jgi:hypothetical protein
MSDTPAACPACGADLRGDPIPEEYRDTHYGGATHYQRVIGLYAFDRTVGYACPECDARWPRPGHEDFFKRSGAASWDMGAGEKQAAVSEAERIIRGG